MSYPRRGHWIAKTRDEQIEWWVGNLLYYTPDHVMHIAEQTLDRLEPAMATEIRQKLNECRKQMIPTERFLDATNICDDCFNQLPVLLLFQADLDPVSRKAVTSENDRCDVCEQDHKHVRIGQVIEK